MQKSSVGRRQLVDGRRVEGGWADVDSHKNRMYKQHVVTASTKVDATKF